MKAKQIIVSVVFTLFLCVVLLSASVFAADPMGIAVEDVIGKPGDVVEVEISLDNNPGISSLGFEVEYDHDALSFESGMITATFSGVQDSSSSAREGTKGLIVNWYTGSSETSEEGTFAVLKFKIKEDATLGKYDFNLVVDPEDVYNIDEDNVDFSVTSKGSITVSETGLRKVEAVSPTCTKDGNIEYWTDGEKYYSDEAGTQELSAEEVIVKATGHKYGEPTWTWKSDNSGATANFTCKDNDDTKAVETEEITTNTVEPTCTKPGEIAYTAVVTFGGQEYQNTKTVAIAANGHNPGAAKKENEEAATCTVDGKYDEVVYCTVCNEELSRETTVVPAEGHHMQHFEAQEATCTESGRNEYYLCSVCERMYLDEEGTREASDADIVIPATGHDWDEWIIVQEATEETEGERMRVCKKDPSHTETEVIPVLEHVHSMVKTDAVEATCTTDGNIEYYYCSKCEKYYTDEEGTTEISLEDTVIEAYGHEYESNVIKEATCDEPGLIEYVCTHDSTHTYTEDVPPLGHSLSRVGAVAATCEEPGHIEYYQCAVCEKMYADSEGREQLTESDIVIAATGHDWGQWTVTKEATEEAAGEETRVCNNDPDHIETREIPPLAHTHVLKKVEAVAATCEKDGNTDYYTCSGCGQLFADEAGEQQIDREDTILKALGHDWGDWIVTEEPTCTEAGTETRTCGNDTSHTETRDIPSTGHKWGEWTETTAPTCTEPGVETRICENDADHTETRETAALGHEWGAWTTTKKPTCTEPGMETRVCSNDASHTESREIAAAGHDWNAWTTTKEATCTEEGEETRTCKTDSSHKETRKIPAKGHHWSEWVITKPATATEAGIKTRTCNTDPEHPHTETVEYQLNTYTVTFDANGGTGSMAAKEVNEGEKLTLPTCSFTAPKGKEFDKWNLGTVGAQVSITADTTVKAVWKDKPHEQICPSKVFKDVNPNPSNWYHPHVDYAVEHGLMNGTSATTFEPDGTITRAMVVTILYRMSGEPAVSGNSGFSDVPSGRYYSNAIKWATDKGIAKGVGGGKFEPDAPVTREQMSTFLMRYAKFKGKSTSTSTSLSGYTDAGKVSSWAVDAVKWSVGNGIIVGTSATTLDPESTATRAQFATIVHRYLDKFGG